LSIELWVGNGRDVGGTSAADVFDLSGLTSVSGLPSVRGSSGNDTILGSHFADDLRGDAGNDTLNGGGGNDRLTGGSGNDTFVFADGGGADIITDYKVGQDMVDLTGVAGVSDFSDLHLAQIDSKTVLVDFDGVLGEDTLTIHGTTVLGLQAHQADFLFA
jgi:Ca2+-binding RTX toxin-like protein